MTFRKTTEFSAFTLLVAALFASGCGSGSTSASPTAPSGVNLTGTWAGTILDSGSKDTPSAATWTATQSGTSATGAFVFTAPNAVKIAGTLAGVMSGSQVAWTMTFPAGAFTAFGAPTCSATATGTSPSVTANSVVATLTLTYSAPCLGVITDKTTEIDILTLSK